MDTEKTFMLHNQGPDLLFSELSKDELAVAKEHVEIIPAPAGDSPALSDVPVRLRQF